MLRFWWMIGKTVPTSESGQVLKGLIDKAASELSEGVEINEHGDTVFIPYMGSNFRLVLKAEEDATLW